MTTELAIARTGTARLLRIAGSAACLMTAAYYVATTTLAVWSLGWTEMFADQFRQYARLLEVPFPANVFAPDNAHRQVTSNLVRLADIHWGQGDQTIGVVAGLIVLGLAMLVLGLRIWSDKAHGHAFRSAGVLAAAVALMWLGAARMQLHGNESFQVYLVVTCALVVLHCVERLRLEPSLRAATFAVLAASVALLSFGTGVAVFGLLVFMMFLRRVERRWLTAIALIGGAAVIAYMFWLPGGDSVRGSLSDSPLDIARNAITWLASSWTTGWLAFGSEGASGLNLEAMSSTTLGAALVVSSQAVFAATGHPGLLSLAFVIGAIGIAILAGLSWRAWRQPGSVTSTEALGLGLSIFAVGIAVLVALGRTEAFAVHPSQVLADRYQPWTNLFWLGLFLAGASRIAKKSRREAVAVVAALVLSALIYPTHTYWHGWSVAVERAIERGAAQVQSGVFPVGFTVHTDMPNIGAAKDAIEVLRRHRVGMFRVPRNHLMGASVVLPETVEPGSLALVRSLAPVEEEIVAKQPAWHLEGVLEDAELRERIDGLFVADADGSVVGMGEFGFSTVMQVRHRIDTVADGFDVYFRAAAPCQGLTLFGIDDEAQHIIALAPISECGPSAP